MGTITEIYGDHTVFAYTTEVKGKPGTWMGNFRITKDLEHITGESVATLFDDETEALHNALDVAKQKVDELPKS